MDEASDRATEASFPPDSESIVRSRSGCYRVLGLLFTHRVRRFLRKVRISTGRALLPVLLVAASFTTISFLGLVASANESEPFLQEIGDRIPSFLLEGDGGWPTGFTITILWMVLRRPGGAGWVGAALRFRDWTSAALTAVLLLTAGNLLVFGDAWFGEVGVRASAEGVTMNDGCADTDALPPRDRFGFAFYWTTQRLMMGETPTEATCQQLPLESVLQIPALFQLSLNWITGWSLFALGIALIHRKATRG